MRKFLACFLLLFFTILCKNSFAVEYPQGRIDERYYGGTTYVTLEFKTTGSPYEGRFGCGTPANDPDLSHGFSITTIGSNGIPSVQMNVNGSSSESADSGDTISYILQTSYTQPGSCPYGSDLWFITFSWSGGVYTLHDAVKLINTGTPSSPIWNIPFMGFPLASLTAYSAEITSVMDHDNVSDRVTAYTGEIGDEEYGSILSDGVYGYMQDGEGAFVINGNYTGGDHDDYLFYNNHTGYDYAASKDNGGTPVYAVADGIITSSQCPADGTSCTDMGQVVITHKNDYTTWYLHLDHLDVNEQVHPNWAVNEIIHKGDILGYSGDTGASGSPHLHFTVKNEDGNKVDPYGWTGTKDADPLQRHGYDSTRLWD